MESKARRVSQGSRLVLRIVLAILVVISTVALAKAETPGPDLDRLVAAKEYGALERELPAAKITDPERTYYQGLLANHLNRATVSVQQLESILRALEATNPLRAEYAMCALAEDYVKLGQYSEGSENYALAAHIAQSQERDSVCHADRESARWALFKDAPAQTVAASGVTQVQGTRDKLGLLQIPVSAGSYTGSWLLDTGANLTVIRRSAAEQMGVQLSSSAQSAQGSSGLWVSVRAAIIPELRIGSAVVKNVPTLVVEDADLQFNSVGYKIEGSLGLPVLAALGKLSINKDGSIALGRPQGEKVVPSATHNLFFEGLTPIVQANLGYGPNLFVLDTGAQGTILSPKFYAETGSSNHLGQLVTLDLAGAGGVGSVAAYGPASLSADFGNACLTLTDAHVLTSEMGAENEFYGFLGQGSFAQATSITLDFDAMQFRVTGGDGCATGAVAAAR